MEGLLVLHAKPGPGLARRALPALLLSACTAAFGGLAALAPDEPAQPSVLAYADSRVVPLTELVPPSQERATARASRSRRLDEQERARAAAAAKAAADAKARADAAAAAAAAKAQAEAAAKAQAAAAAKAKAQVAAAAKAQAQAAAAARAKVATTRIAGRCPVPNASFTDTWGAARSGGRGHKGTDLLAPYGSPVYAVAAGRIRSAYSSSGGISLYLDADNGETYFYAHNSANVVRSGRVAAGQLIARVGSTGNAGGTNHVHFEREVGGRSVNPYTFVRRLC
jgi:murein DD-endopeptidase MepM/ murein hydrolase activator NlpD